MLSRENEARVNAYADWLVNNQSRKGSPEYTEVENSYKSLRAQQMAEPGFGDQARALLGGIGEASGIPQAVRGLGNITGSETISDIGGRMGGLVDGRYDPRTMPAREAGRTVGYSAMGIPALSTAARGSTAVRGMAPITPSTANVSTLQRVTDPIIQPFVRSPGRAATAEVGFGGVAGTGTFAAETLAPGDDAVRALAETGMTLGYGAIHDQVKRAGTTVFNIGRTAVNNLRQTFKSLTPEGRNSEAGKILMQAIANSGEDPKVIMKALNDRKGALSTAAQTSGSRGLSAVEKTLIGGDDAFKVSVRQQGDQELARLENEIRTLENSGNVELVKAGAQMRKDTINGYLDQRLKRAETVASKAIADLDSGVTKTAASVKTRKIIDDAIKSAREDEKKLWERLDKTMPIEVGSLVNLRRSLIDKGDILPEDKLPGVLPAVLRRFKKLSKASAESEEIVRAFGGEAPAAATVKSNDIIKFRSRILALQRAASNDGRFDDARIYGKYADEALSLLSDLPNAATARAFSQQLNAKLTNSVIADITQRRPRGAAPFRPETTLEAVFQGSPEQQVAARDELISGVTPVTREDQTAAVDMTNPQQANEAMGDFLRAMAIETVKDGKIDNAALANFRRNNSELLSKYPELLTSVQSAESAQASLSQLQQNIPTLRRSINEGKYASVIGTENLDALIVEALTTGAKKTPVKNIRTLSLFAKKAGSPGSENQQNAIDGLRSSIINYAMAQENPYAAFTQPLGTNQPSIKKLLVQQGILSKKQGDAFEIMIGGFTQAQNRQNVIGDVAKIDEMFGPISKSVDLMSRLIGSYLINLSPAINQNNSLIMSGAAARTATQTILKDPRAAIRETLKDIIKDPQRTAQVLELAKPAKPRAPIIGEQQLADAFDGMVSVYKDLPSKFFTGTGFLIGLGMPRTVRPGASAAIIGEAATGEAMDAYNELTQ